MRVRLVGTRDQRQRLRRILESVGVQVVGEFDGPGHAMGAPDDALTVVISPNDVETRSDLMPMVEPLTPREHSVLQVLVEGLSNKRIAERLGISDQTVKFHIASICGKLGAINRTDAVRMAIQRGLVAI